MYMTKVVVGCGYFCVLDFSIQSALRKKLRRVSGFFRARWRKCAFEFRPGTHSAANKIPKLWLFFFANPSSRIFLAPSEENANLKYGLVHISPRKNAGKLGVFLAKPSLGFFLPPYVEVAHLNRDLVRISPQNNAGELSFFFLAAIPSRFLFRAAWGKSNLSFDLIRILPPREDAGYLARFFGGTASVLFVGAI